MHTPISPKTSSSASLSPLLTRFKDSTVASPPAPGSKLRLQNQNLQYTPATAKGLLTRAIQWVGNTSHDPNEEKNAFYTFRGECILTFGETITNNVYNRLNLKNAQSITAQQASNVLIELENEFKANPHQHPLYTLDINATPLPISLKKNLEQTVTQLFNNVLLSQSEELNDTFTQDIKRNPMRIESRNLNYSEHKFELNPTLSTPEHFQNTINETYPELVRQYPQLSRNLSWLMTQTLPNQLTAAINGNTEELSFSHLNEMRAKGELLTALGLQGELDLEVMCQLKPATTPPVFEINFLIAKKVNHYFDVTGITGNGMQAVDPENSALIIKINLEYTLPEQNDNTSFGKIQILDNSLYEHHLTPISS